MLWNSSSNTECYFSFLSNFKGISAIKLGVPQPKNISAVSFFGLLDNNASCVSNRVNIALFGTSWKENLRRRWEKSARLGQHLTWKRVVNINCRGATKFSRAVGEDLSCPSKCILEEKPHCSQLNCWPWACRFVVHDQKKWKDGNGKCWQWWPQNQFLCILGAQKNRVIFRKGFAGCYLTVNWILWTGETTWGWDASPWWKTFNQDLGLLRVPTAREMLDLRFPKYSLVWQAAANCL